MILDFKSLIVAESEIVGSDKSDRFKLEYLGRVYYECAEGLDKRSSELLDLATRTVTDGDSIVDETFSQHLESWMRSSIAGNFLDAYLLPKTRKSYDRSSVEITEIAPALAVKNFAPDEVQTESENIVAETFSIAHEENVQLWAEYLTEVMTLWGLQHYTFRQLVALTNLSPGQVFLAVFLGDRFEFRSRKDFYDAFLISIAR